MNPRLRNPGMGLLALGLLWIVLYWAASPHAAPVDDFDEPGAIIVQGPGAERPGGGAAGTVEDPADRSGPEPERGRAEANRRTPAGMDAPPPVGRRPQDASPSTPRERGDAPDRSGSRRESQPDPRPDPEPAAASYTVRSGDSLTLISQRVYGSARHWGLLYEANRDRIPDPDRLRVGTELRVPPLPDGR